MTPLRILIVAQDPLARAGLAAALASEPGMVGKTISFAVQPMCVRSPL